MESPAPKIKNEKNLYTPYFLFQSKPSNNFYNKKNNKIELNDNFIKQTKFIGNNNSELISITNHNEIYLNKINISENNENKIEEKDISQNYQISSELIFKENNPIYDIDMYIKIKIILKKIL